MKPVSDRTHLWFWLLAGLLLVGLILGTCRNGHAAQAPVLLNRPRFSELHVIASYDAANTRMTNCVVRATFSIDCLEPDGHTITQSNISLPDFDLLKEASQTVVNTDNIQTSFGDIAKDVLAVLEHKWKQAHPDPLPLRRALRNAPQPPP